MIIDLTTAQVCREELKRCRTEMMHLYEGVRRVYVELSAEEADILEEPVRDLYNKMNDMEQEILNLKTMIRALDSIISVYDRTERKNIRRIEGYSNRISDTTRFVEIESNIPRDIISLFR